MCKKRPMKGGTIIVLASVHATPTKKMPNYLCCKLHVLQIKPTPLPRGLTFWKLQIQFSQSLLHVVRYLGWVHIASRHGTDLRRKLPWSKANAVSQINRNHNISHIFTAHTRPSTLTQLRPCTQHTIAHTQTRTAFVTILGLVMDRNTSNIPEMDKLYLPVEIGVT